MMVVVVVMMMITSFQEWLEADPYSAGVDRSILEMLLSHEAKI